MEAGVVVVIVGERERIAPQLPGRLTVAAKGGLEKGELRSGPDVVAPIHRCVGVETTDAPQPHDPELAVVAEHHPAGFSGPKRLCIANLEVITLARRVRLKPDDREFHRSSGKDSGDEAIVRTIVGAEKPTSAHGNASGVGASERIGHRASALDHDEGHRHIRHRPAELVANADARYLGDRGACGGDQWSVAERLERRRNRSGRCGHGAARSRRVAMVAASDSNQHTGE